MSVNQIFDKEVKKYFVIEEIITKCLRDCNTCRGTYEGTYGLPLRVICKCPCHRENKDRNFDNISHNDFTANTFLKKPTLSAIQQKSRGLSIDEQRIT